MSFTKRQILHKQKEQPDNLRDMVSRLHSLNLPCTYDGVTYELLTKPKRQELTTSDTAEEGFAHNVLSCLPRDAIAACLD